MPTTTALRAAPVGVEPRVDLQIADVASSRPSALAVAGGASKLTYGELDAFACALADRLREHGVRPESRVGLCLPRSPELLAALLGIFKAGAAAVLVDPAWPAGRIEGILEVARASVVVGTGRGTADVHTLGLPPPRAADGASLGGPSGGLAYLVCTSGSTGTPKLVGVTHRALARRAALYRDGYRISPRDRATWLSPPGTSISAAELWPYLSAGASVFAADPAVVASPAELRDWLVETHITKAFVMMPLAEALFAQRWPSTSSLELVTVAGDTVHRWPEGMPFEVVVEYGSAEANAVCSGLVPWEERLTSATAAEDRDSRPPLGRPWPGVGVRVVDSELRNVEPGEVGELCVSSDQLARGYMDDAAATAAAFVPDGANGARMYRTGDLVHVRPDGHLVHHGRIDAQVKIAGLRVEVAEVETALLEHPSVEHVVVVAVDDPGGTRRLAAYVVPTRPVRAAELRAHTLSQLPEPFVPAVYTFLESLPLTAAMKVDRAALPEPIWGSARALDSEPQDEIGHEVAKAWSEVLGFPLTSSDANFFEEGGTSLLAGKLIGRIRERWQIPLRMSDFSREPTASGLARETRALLAQTAARRNGHD